MIVIPLKMLYYTGLLNCRVGEAWPYAEVSLRRPRPGSIWREKKPTRRRTALVPRPLRVKAKGPAGWQRALFSVKICPQSSGFLSGDLHLLPAIHWTDAVYPQGCGLGLADLYGTTTLEHDMW